MLFSACGATWSPVAGRQTHLCDIRWIPIECFRQIVEGVLFVHNEQVLLSQRMRQIDDLQQIPIADRLHCSWLMCCRTLALAATLFTCKIICGREFGFHKLEKEKNKKWNRYHCCCRPQKFKNSKNKINGIDVCFSRFVFPIRLFCGMHSDTRNAKMTRLSRTQIHSSRAISLNNNKQSVTVARNELILLYVDSLFCCWLLCMCTVHWAVSVIVCCRLLHILYIIF